MYEMLWLVPALPLAGFALLALGRFFPRQAVTAVGVGSVGLSTAVAFALALRFIISPPPGSLYVQHVWAWLQSGGLQAGVALYLDTLSLVMVVVITSVSFLIHIYSTRFMAGDEGYRRFFAYMNLFVASMLILVLADNLLLLFLGWEAVGLCSYLLIGFWYADPETGRAAIKAFVVTRIGDVALLAGLLLLFATLGTLDVQTLMQKASGRWAPGAPLAVASAALLLGGALGKSAQLPLQTWLPDAMAGPTPVSALIHAATMVTAGVYLIARTHTLFSLAPSVQRAVAAIGLATLLMAGFSAVTQRDIKKVLAYSTMSQVGYMFLGLGVGAWQAAVLHFVTHAFFKSLLFLSAGAIILALDHQQDLFAMGGLRRRLPLVFWTFLVGALSMSALPPLSAGFSSKDWILYLTWSSPMGGVLFWALALAGVALTSLYTFRMVFLAFFGPPHSEPQIRRCTALYVPLVVLAVPAALIGLIELPRTLGNVTLFSDFIGSSLPAPGGRLPPMGTEGILEIASEAASLIGLGLAFLAFRRNVALQAEAKVPGVGRFLAGGWGFDRLYDRLFVRPLRCVADKGREDVLDLPFRALAGLTRRLHHALSRTQTGQLRWYAFALALGLAAILALVVLR